MYSVHSLMEDNLVAQVQRVRRAVQSVLQVPQVSRAIQVLREAWVLLEVLVPQQTQVRQETQDLQVRLEQVLQVPQVQSVRRDPLGSPPTQVPQDPREHRERLEQQ